MGQDTRDQTGSADQLGDATEEVHNTLAQLIMRCGEEVAASCVNRRKVTPPMLEYVNSAIIDCVADCIDVLRGEKNDAGINNR